MKLNEQQRKEFEEVVKPVIDWINKPGNGHAHCHIIIDSMHAEVSEGYGIFSTEEYLRD